MNLITDKWLPIKRQNGSIETIAPWQITDQIEHNPIISLNLPRPDFNGAIVQFLIGLFQTVYIPEEESDWESNFKNPPSQETLESACRVYQSAFNLDDVGPRFMQDFELTEKSEDPKPIGNLLMDEPGEQTLKHNVDIFVKRHRVSFLSLPYAAISLFTLQLNAPAGGAGHRTSLRGGGPLTTLVVPKEESKQTLWHLLWMNLLSKETASKLYDASRYNADEEYIPLESIFPWMAPTKTSEAKQETLPEDVHWLQLYWAMPRRIKLKFSSIKEGSCDIGNQEVTSVLSEYITKNYGANYVQWRHPLSPYYQNKEELLPLHPNIGGMTYKHWLGWALGINGKSTVKRARIVQISVDGRRKKYQSRLWSFGYDMDNMKARGWQESKMPLFYFDTLEVEENFRSAVIEILGATEEVVKNLRGAVKKAWKVDRGDIRFVESEFWQTTDEEFYKLLDEISKRIKESIGDEVRDLRQDWHSSITEKSLNLFDHWTMSSDIGMEDTETIILQRKNLRKFNRSKSIANALRLEQKNKEVTQ